MASVGVDYLPVLFGDGVCVSVVAGQRGNVFGVLGAEHGDKHAGHCHCIDNFFVKRGIKPVNRGIWFQDWGGKVLNCVL